MTILIVGGAYQGKRAYAEEKFGLLPEEIAAPEEEQLTASVRCIDRLHLRVQKLLASGTDRDRELELLYQLCKDKVVICDDISCGIVPLDPEQREWRELTGRLLCRIAKQADLVVRIQCGLAQIIKEAKE